MIFTSYLYVAFLILVLGVNSLLPKKHRWIWLLISSYFFLYTWDLKFCLILFAYTLITYFIGVLIDKSQQRKTKRIWLNVGLLLIIGGLFVFKYLNFSIESLASVLAFAGVQTDFNMVHLFLPAGISFYTFQSISYMVDVSNGRSKVEKHFGKFALFLAFFPKLISGPIERAHEFIPQIDNPTSYTYDEMIENMIRIGWGIFKKLVIANRLAVMTRTVFDSGDLFKYSGIQLLFIVFIYAFQIYIDFDAYSDIAIGAGRLLGFKLTENFKRPYFSKNIVEFWRRWHISLSNWLRDYLFIPLNFSSRRRKHKQLWQYINIMIVFLISGIWHGSAWTFVIWGGLHGAYQVWEAATAKIRKTILTKLKIDPNSFGHKFYQVFITFGLATVAWIFFRANSIMDALVVGKRILFMRSLYLPESWVFKTAFGLDEKDFTLALIALALFIIVEFASRRINIRQELVKQPIYFRWPIYLLLIFGMIIFGYYGSNDPTDFIYFQF